MVVASASITVLELLFITAGGVAALCGLYLLLLSIAAFFYVGFRGARRPPRTRLCVVVPAHDEAELIARCVSSLRAQTYPSALYEVVVVADNCTDDTAAIAAGEGARVMVRDDPAARGKGNALRWATDRILAAAPAPDAVVIVDADSVADPEFLLALVQPFEAGALAVQGESLLAGNGSTAARLRVAAFLLINRVRPAGHTVFRLPCTLAGNGMLLARELLTTRPWNAFTSAEDVEYSLGLRMAGVDIAFAGGAILLSPVAPSRRAAIQQQLRWEGGKARLARTWLRRLASEAVRGRRPSLLVTAADLAMPPLGYLSAMVIVGALAGSGLASAELLPPSAVAPWLLALLLLPLSVLVGLRAAEAPKSAYLAMAGAPFFVVSKIARLPRVLGFRADTWVRTERKTTARRQRST
jgi:1,2-diacylglycerol 3-beta-glucosyltransferase